MNKVFRQIAYLLGSKGLSVWMVCAWLIYYVTMTIWSKEAFATFVKVLSENILFQGLFVIFLINLSMRSFTYVRQRGGGGRLGRIGGGALLAGVLLLLLGFLVSVTTKRPMRSLVGEEHIIHTPWDGRRYKVQKVVPSLKSSVLDIDEGLGIFRFEPIITVESGSRLKEVGAFPPSRFGRTYMHILQCGLAPGVKVSRNGQVFHEGYAALRLLPPGGTDVLKIERTPYSFLVKLVPVEILRKGELEAGRYDLTDPLYDIRVLRGNEEIARGRSDEKIDFDGQSLEILPTTYWAFLDVVRDDGIPIVASGLILMALGLLLKLARWSWITFRLIFLGRAPFAPQNNQH